MQKRTTLRPKSRRQVSPTRQDSGLIAKTKKTVQRSAGTKSALDDRSHRTARQRQRRALLISGLEPIFEEDAVEPRSLPKVQEEPDLEICRCEGGKELPLAIGVEGFSGFVLDDHCVVDQHVHPLVRDRFATKVD
jgi:hypothetical protein